jgi:Cu/Ag efflux pump CusA
MRQFTNRGSNCMSFTNSEFRHLQGAEVQRPLATVVIGGLFTATILTIVVYQFYSRFF